MNKDNHKNVYNVFIFNYLYLFIFISIYLYLILYIILYIILILSLVGIAESGLRRWKRNHDTDCLRTIGEALILIDGLYIVTA